MERRNGAKQFERMQVKDVNGIPTHVFSLKSHKQNDELLLIVPGSPGVGHCYIPFANRLFDLGRGDYDVSVVSHAGHSPGLIKPVDSLDRDWYSLEDQLAHKLAYIKEQAADKEVLCLVGHSIGCYIALHMLKHLPPSRVKKVILLFPAMEKLAITPNGKFWSPLCTSFRYPFVALMTLISWLPEALKRALYRKYYDAVQTPPEHVEHMIQATLNLTGSSFYNILCMAQQEMEEVDLPVDIISERIEKFVFYYGSDDPWTLKSCYEDMVKRFPDRDVNLCTSGYMHAFVITASNEMADFVFSRLAE